MALHIIFLFALCFLESETIISNQLIPNVHDFSRILSQFTQREIVFFDIFKNVYNKSYLNSVEEQAAMLNFLVNQRDINEHNLRYEAGLVSFTRAVWEYSDKTSEEVNRCMNGFKRPVEAKLAKEQEASYKEPKSLNWATRGYVTAVQSQKLCAACWSFSTTGAIEGQIFKKTGQLVKLSDQNLIDCNRDLELGNFGCSGGDMINAFNYLSNNGGLALASEYPYMAGDWFGCNQVQSSNGNITSYETIESGDETLLMKFVSIKGPISIAIDASLASFQSYKNGIYYDEKCSLNINHAMLLVGFGRDKKTKKDYWLVKNSYGANWGENGFVRIARNAGNHCGIAEFPSVPIL